MAVAAVTVRNPERSTFLLDISKPGHSVNIETEDQMYRIKVNGDGSLEIMSEHFINSTLSIRPVVTNIVTVKGVER